MEQEKLFEIRNVGLDPDHQLARIEDPATSVKSDSALRKREGASNTIRRGTHRHLALECFYLRGSLIAEDVKVLTGIDGIWKRVSDLKNMGLIEPTGHTRLSREGRESETYVITPAGEANYTLLGSTGKSW